MTKKRLIKECKKYEKTADYTYSDTDVILEADGYLLIYQPDTIGNLVFLKISDTHKYTLLQMVKHFSELLYLKYGVRIVTIKNKKWKYVMNKLKELQLIYENEEYCIYVREDLY